MNAILDDLKIALGALGYDVQNEDAPLLDMAVNASEESICNAINQDAVPDGLHYAWVDRACGRFLQVKGWTGGLTSDNVDSLTGAQSVSVGDTSVTFNSDDPPGKRLDALIAALRTSGSDDLNRYRKLVW